MQGDLAVKLSLRLNKVIALYEQIKKNTKKIGIIDKLLQNPIKINNFQPFNRDDIYE